jgi:stage V sporulation protein G
LRIINGARGLFVAMPNKKLKDGTFKDIAHPLNSETRKQLEEKILAEYEKVQDQTSDVSSATVSEDYLNPAY